MRLQLPLQEPTTSWSSMMLDSPKQEGGARIGVPDEGAAAVTAAARADPMQAGSSTSTQAGIAAAPVAQPTESGWPRSTFGDGER